MHPIARTTLGFCLLLIGIAHAQGFPTDFPANATPLSAEQLRMRVQDKVFTLQPASGPSMRIQYKGEYAYINIGSSSDAGPWRVDGSSICNDWRRFTASCSEVRLLGDVLYVKRKSNNEVMAMTVQP